MLKQVLTALVLLVGVSQAFASMPVICAVTAIHNKALISHMDGSEIGILCAGATSLAPVNCAVEAFSQEELRAHMSSISIAKLCAESKSAITTR